MMPSRLGKTVTMTMNRQSGSECSSGSMCAMFSLRTKASTKSVLLSSQMAKQILQAKGAVSWRQNRNGILFHLASQWHSSVLFCE